MCFLKGDDVSLQSIGSCGFDVDVPPMSHLSQSIESPAGFINKQLCIVKQSHNAFERHIFSFYLDIIVINTHFWVSPRHRNHFTLGAASTHCGNNLHIAVKF